MRCRGINRGGVAAGGGDCYWFRTMPNHALRFSLLILAAGCSAAYAQTPLRQQTVVPADPCLGLETVDLGSCGMEALGDKNYAAARKAWTLATQHGDYQAANWLAEMYAQGSGTKVDNVQAYQWFDIAAALHARAIARERPAGDAIGRDSNQGEIDRRNAVAKKLKSTQISQAQQLSRNWQKANPHAVDEAMGFTP